MTKPTDADLKLLRDLKVGWVDKEALKKLLLAILPKPKDKPCEKL